jgi:anti-anti-sigma regulatory factor
MRLTMVLKSARPVTVDVRAVRRIDTASMQLLAAFARDRRSSGLAVATVGDSPAFDEAVRLLGLAAILKPTAAAAPPP